MPRPDALDQRHLEADPQAPGNLLVVDVDRPDQPAAAR
ncbi:hypothetical protein RAJCM14343_5242 [Rhodococcus aetherivorans]|uniref:Uncharacterized protein n=1 Tax=Rhodococcus aetherivorans TaxID=191292 RepID=A0ABQ0YTM9_9NOCA|nr:hypothetical protein RAJCM14343_5242 [Rhodococcus aetherivorans]